MKTEILQFNPRNIAKCAREISAGGLVAFPTETVYGLGANALDPQSAKKIYAAKGRPSDNPLICHIADISQLDSLAYITPSAQKLIEKFMPGPLTIVLKKKESVPNVVTGGLETVGIRMPAHPCALALIRECNVPLCAPSANTSSRPSPTIARHVKDDLDGKIRYILDGGPCRVGVESTIVDCVNNVLLRKGGISQKAVEEVIGKLSDPPNSDVPLCPGMKYKHYSPSAEVYVAQYGADMHSRIEKKYDELPGKKIILTINGDYKHRKTAVVGNNAEEYAHNLFAAFRGLDNVGYDVIICEGVDEAGIGAALMNRITKASGGKTF